MDGIRSYAVRLFIYMALLFSCNGIYGQYLRQPELQFSAPCASATFNEFHVNFSWDPPLVNPDNQFILELSDKNGSFSNATTLVSYNDKNTIFKFEFVFGLPTNVYGDGYKVRVRSTSPQKTSPESPVFPAYYLTVNDPLVINNFVGEVYSCDGSPVTIKVDNYPNQPAYRWYRNGTYLSSETHSSITTSQAGIYYVELDYGSTCSSATLSNAVEVINGQSTSLSILGTSTRQICRQQSYLLEASINDPLLLYQWYKDGQPVWPLGYYPTIDLSAFDNAAGNWYVIAQRSGGCSQQSNTVNVQYRTLNASLQSLSGTTLLPWEQVVLEATTDASQPSYSWYKDNAIIANATQQRLTVTQPGTYFAKITETTDCTQAVETSRITIKAPAEYSLSIGKSQDYISCVSLSTQLNVDKILAIMADGSQMDIYDAGIAKFNFQWYKDSQLVNNATQTSINLSDASENGLYYITAIYGNLTVKSNEEVIQLGLASALVILGESVIEICNQQSYVLQASIDDPTLIYQWYKNDQPVSQQGYYPEFDVSTVDNAEGNWFVEIKRAQGCSLRSNNVSIQYKTINASLQSLSGTVLLPGDQIILEAASSAAQPNYSWYKNDVLLSGETQQRLTVTEPGSYYAKIIDSADCNLEIITAKITIDAPTDLIITINKSSDFIDCLSTSVTLSVESLSAILSDGSIINIINSNSDSFSFQWYKDNQAISGETYTTLALNDVSQNGAYYITAVSTDFNIKSNIETIQMGFASEVAISSTGSLSCDGSNGITISSSITDSSYYYQWYFNGQILNTQIQPNLETNESGEYRLAVSGNGCTIYSNVLVIDPINLDIVTIDAGEYVTIPEGGSITVSASGADSYAWYNSITMEFLSNNQAVTITDAGTYQVVANLNGCEITKSLVVEYVESFAVPNVITPNADGYNDKWILPNTYAKRDNVEVSIFTLNGDKVIQTYNYQNDWPQSNTSLKYGQKPLFLYRIIKDNTVLKKGTITVID